MAVNKVEANGETLIDLTSDTVTADTLLSGRTAHLASGAQVTGTFEPVTGVKGNAESAYRKGNVNLTPTNIGAATSEQGAKADSAVQTIQISGTTQTKTGGTVNLPAYPTKSSLGLGNVDNTSDANKPISTAAQAALDKQQAQINAALKQTGYNLLEITNDTQTINGITFTVDKAAGTITADGTATAQVAFVINSNVGLSLNYKGELWSDGSPSGSSTKTYFLNYEDDNGRNVNCYTNEPILLTNTTHPATITRALIYIRSGVTVNNLVFKPMITTAELAGVPFQPYAMSNVELTQKALIPKVDSNHNGIFRGKDLTNIYTVDEMYNMVHSGNFDDLFLGDYFTKSITTDIYTKFAGTAFESGVTYYERSGDSLLNWTYIETSDAAYDSSKTYYTKLTKTENVTLMFAAFDYYYNVGDTALTTHHAILIPRNYGFATTSKMNPTNTTVGSYYNSEMHQTTLPCYAKSLKTALNNHLLSHRTILPNAINASTPSMAGAGMTGASNAWAWETVELQLMSEPQFYGTTVWSSSAYDVGADYKKLPVFDFINGVQYGHGFYWLRSVVSSAHFAYCSSDGLAGDNGASSALYVRPLILFG